MFKRYQPNTTLNRTRRLDRNTDELIGICRGVLADGSINVSEMAFLRDWVDRHQEFAHEYIFNALFHRIADALTDGVISADEERDLLALLQGVVGGEADGEQSVASLTSTLPLDDPPPSINFNDHVFVVTGTFDFGPRSAVIEAIETRGGTVRDALSSRTDYLVVGMLGSRDWIHSSYGRKIEQALKLREEGATLVIIGEAHLRASL